MPLEMAWRMANDGVRFINPRRGARIGTIDLRSVTTTPDANADVNTSKALTAESEDGLENLSAEDLRANELDGAAVDLNEAAALLHHGDSHSGLL